MCAGGIWFGNDLKTFSNILYSYQQKQRRHCYMYSWNSVTFEEKAELCLFLGHGDGVYCVNICLLLHRRRFKSIVAIPLLVFTLSLQHGIPIQRSVIHTLGHHSIGSRNPYHWHMVVPC